MFKSHNHTSKSSITKHSKVMLTKRSKPLIEKFTGSWISGAGIRLVDGAATSARNPLEMKISSSQSPSGLKSYNFGGVGLGIVAALEESDSIGTKFHANKPLYNRKLNKSRPISSNTTKVSTTHGRRCENVEIEMDGFEEEYTFVTCHGPDHNKSGTRVYRDAGEDRQGRRKDVDQTVDSRRCEKSKTGLVFHESESRFGVFRGYPTSDFLSSCHLCQKKLHGKDIYMYRGEKAFCSPECRYTQIIMDERKEKCRSEASSTSVDVSTSQYTTDQIFSTGILAI